MWSEEFKLCENLQGECPPPTSEPKLVEYKCEQGYGIGMFGKRVWLLLSSYPSIRPGWVLDQLHHSAWGVDRNPSWLWAASVKMKFMTLFFSPTPPHTCNVGGAAEWFVTQYSLKMDWFLVGVVVQRGKVGMCSHIPHMHWTPASFSLLLYLEQRVPKGAIWDCLWLPGSAAILSLWWTWLQNLGTTFLF